jgi:hypothetical protein
MLGAATDAEMAVAPSPASTADRTASFDGARDGPAHQRGVGDVPFHKAEFGRAGKNGCGDLRRVADRQPNVDVRVSATEGHEMTGQPETGDGLARLHRQRPALQAGELRKRQLGHLDAPENGPRLAKEKRAGLRQLDTSPDAVELLDLVSRLERRDRRADRRLGQVQSFGRPGDVLTFCDGDENAKLLKGHARQDTMPRAPG